MDEGERWTGTEGRLDIVRVERCHSEKSAAGYMEI